MPHVTLLHTRWPKDEFILDDSVEGGIRDDVDDLAADDRAKLYKRRKSAIKRTSGLWGTMMVIVGGQIRLARFDHPYGADALLAGESVDQTEINGRKIHLVVEGGRESQKLYTTVERYRNNDGTLHQKYDYGYVRLVSRAEPYGLKTATGSKTVQTLRKDHDGAYIKIEGTAPGQQSNILIHEAPHVGWVVGCIGPRPFGNRGLFRNEPGNPSDLAFREIYRTLQAHGKGRGRLFVLVS